MAITVTCVQCGKTYRIDEKLTGKKGKCKDCGAVFVVKADEPTTEPVPSARNEEGPIALEPARPSVPARRIEPSPPVGASKSAPAVVPRPILQPGHDSAAPTINVNTPKRSSSFGIAALVVGIVALVGSFVPICGIFATPVALLGLALGVVGLIIALVRKGAGIGYPIAGGAVSGLALIVAIAQVAVLGSTAEEMAESMTAGAAMTARPGSGAGASERAPAPDWISANDAAIIGSTRVEIVEYGVGDVLLKGDYSEAEYTSEEPHLTITLRITNASRTKKLDYRTWAGGDFSVSRDYAVLRDNYDNIYKRVGFGYSTEVVGATEREAVYPGDVINDVLVFELPIDAAKYLVLELPAKNVDEAGMIRFRLPWKH